MEKFIEHIIGQETHILNKTKVEILFICDIKKYREKIDNSYIKFIDYLRENLYDYKIIYYGTNIPKFIKGQQLNMIINKYCTTSEPLIWISGLSGAKLVNKIYDYKGIKILNVNTISDKVKQHINENGYDYVLYTNNVLYKDNIEIEDCPCVKFITIGNYKTNIDLQIMNNIFNKMCEKVVINDNIKIDQIYVSQELKSFKEKFKSKYRLVDYYDRDKPVIFFGLYCSQDFHLIRNHRGFVLMIWGGIDSILIKKWNIHKNIDYMSDEFALTLNLKELIDSYRDNHQKVLLSLIKDKIGHFSISTEYDIPIYFLDVIRRSNIEHLAISNDITYNLLNINVKSRRFVLTFADKSEFKPSIKGNSVNIYTSDKDLIKYESQIYKSIIEKMSDINFIISTEKNENCFIGLILTSYDGDANTVHELGLSGIRCVHNGDFPNSISWKTEDDVINIIREEQNVIGTKDETLALKIIKYFDNEEDWLNINYYKKNAIKILHIIECDEHYRSHLTFNVNYYNIEHIYLTTITNIETKKRLSDKTIYYYNDELDAYNTIIRLNVDAIISASDTILSKYSQKIKKIGVPMYRIYNGIILDYDINKNNKILINNYKYYTKIFCYAKLQIGLDKVGKNNYYGLNGLTQIDYLLNNKDSVNLKEKFCKKMATLDNKYGDIFTKERRYILFLTNNKLHHIDEYTIILNELKNFANKYDYYIIVKVKQYSELSKKFDEFKIDNRVITVNNADLLYDYMFCDIIVVQSGGTAYLESLLIGKPTILCKILDKRDYMNIENFNYDSLLVIEDRKNFETVLNTIESNSYYSVKYVQDVQNLLAEYFNKTEMVSDRIIEMIMEDITHKISVQYY